jgi:two-component system nitrate/nitrite response regulator NarL
MIVLTMHDHPEYFSQFIKSGAHGYVLNTSPPGELVTAIEAVHRGGAYFSPMIARHLLTAEHEHAADIHLTPREEQVLRLIARGLTSKAIAAEIGISIRTVGKYRELLHKKLRLRSIAELTQYAVSRKLIDPAPR